MIWDVFRLCVQSDRDPFPVDLPKKLRKTCQHTLLITRKCSGLIAYSCPVFLITRRIFFSCANLMPARTSSTPVTLIE